MARMPSVMNHSFSQVPKAEIPRSSFDRSSAYKTTLNAGYLYPIFVDEALPGDTFSLNMSCFARLSTPIHPFMDNIKLNSFFFAVPLRLIWANFQRFMGEQANPGDSIDFLVPKMIAPAGGYGELTIFDYMGLPTKVAGFTHMSLPLRAYNLIWNEWFRDQNLQSSVVVQKGDTDDTAGTYTLLRRGKRHDYFTSALPWPQKGPGVDIPLGTSAPVVTNQASTGGASVGIGLTGPPAVTNRALRSDGTHVTTDSTVAGGSVLYADLTNATAATINQLRQAFQVQKLYERDARGGTRYTEIVRAHFNVVSPDARLQRPEYLGGGETTVNLHQVAQTQRSDDTPDATPQANLAAYGTVAASGHGFSKSFTEHCIILGMVSIRADLTYQQGLNRMWSRRSKLDYYWPALSHIGEQTVLNKEIFTQGTAVDDQAFGYQERYAEYRYKPSQLTGLMRSNATQSLDTWHLSQDFATLPLLNQAFIVDNPPIDRVVAVVSEPHFIFDSYMKLRCARPMPVYGVPGLIDHF